MPSRITSQQRLTANIASVGAKTPGDYAAIMRGRAFTKVGTGGGPGSSNMPPRTPGPVVPGSPGWVNQQIAAGRTVPGGGPDPGYDGRPLSPAGGGRGGLTPRTGPAFLTTPSRAGGGGAAPGGATPTVRGGGTATRGGGGGGTVAKGKVRADVGFGTFLGPTSQQTWQRKEEQRLYERDQEARMAPVRLAAEFGASEAAKERQFMAEQREKAFARLSPYLSDLGGAGEGGPGEGATALSTLESAIEMRGEQALAKVAGRTARRGIFRGGPAAALEARVIGETEAGVAGARAQFAESASERRQRERASRRQAVTQLMGSFQ